MEQELTIPERIRAVQSQLRIAIQNHQLLYVKSKSNPSDTDIQNHMNVIQGLILSMGRTQATLLSQYKEEIMKKYNTQNSEISTLRIMSQQLSYNDAPRSIPVYKDYMKKTEKKILSPKGKKDVVFRKPNKMQSLLKINNTDKIDSNRKDLYFDRTKIKIVYTNNNNKKITKPMINPKMQSVLKPKNEKGNGTKNGSGYEDVIDLSEPTSPASSNEEDTKSKGSSTPDSLSDQDSVKTNPTIPKKLVRRFAKKKKYFESTIVLRSNGYLSNICYGQKDDTEIPDSIENVSQEDFLKFFNLVSRSKCDVLKKKRCERKRRSAAGQNNFYNDYFQPSTPKRNKKAPSQVTVETAIEVDDEDDKNVKTSLNCVICDKEGDLETCASCSEVYHPTCSPTSDRGCPTCSAQPSNIKSIVGANSASCSASSSELIKRYLVPNGDS